MFTKLSSLFSKGRRPARRPHVRPAPKPALEQLEDRLAPAGVSFSPDQQTVTIQENSQTWTIARPVVSPWNYQATGTTYWVAPGGSDGGDGSSAHPFATIGHAVAAAGPGDVVYVEAGTYVENLNITKSGLAGKPIIISAAPGALGQVTITPSAQYVTANPDGAVVTVNQANYVWINGFVIEGPMGRAEAPASEHYGANGITWENGAGLGDEATNNVVYDNVHCGLKEMDQHIGAGLLIQGNVIFDNGTNSLDHGIYMPADDVTMNGNVIFNNSGCGIQAYTDPTGQVITHNVIFGNGFAGILLAGSDSQVFDNTCAYNGIGVMYFRLGCTGNVVEHNIFAFNGTDCGYDDGGGKLGDPSNNTDDYNCYYTGTPNPLINPGAHEVLADPLFLNATGGDFRLAQASPAAADGAFAGTTATSVTSSAQPSVAGQSVTFTATVTDVNGGGLPTGVVEFFDGPIDLGPGSVLSGSGASATSTFSTSALSFGVHSIQAIYVATGIFQGSSGTLTQTVAAAANPAVLKTDGSLWEYSPTSGALKLLSPAGTILSVSAVIDSTGQETIYAIASNRTLWQNTNAGWSMLSAGSFQQISAASNKSGRAVVFGVLTDDSLWENSSLFAGGWAMLSPAGTILSVSAVTDFSGDDIAYAITADHHLWQHGPAGWACLSIGSFQQVSGGVNGAGQAVVFGVLTDHSLWEYNPAFSGGWQMLSPAGTILSVTAGGGADEVFAITADQHLWEHNSAGWALLNSQSFSSLSATLAPTGQDEVFATLTDTTFWEFSTVLPDSPMQVILAGGAAFSSTPR